MRASREVVKVRPHTISFRGQAGDYGLLFFVNFGIFSHTFIHCSREATPTTTTTTAKKKVIIASTSNLLLKA